MGMKRYSQRRPITILFSLITISFITVFLYCTVAGADTGAPKRLATAQQGDCAACHTDKVLPENHTGTKGMVLKDCTACHDKDEISLKSKMPTSHVHMLSGILCQTCHGKKAPFEKVDYKNCITCHSTDVLAKVPARGVFLPNPHNSHYGMDVDCSLCHFQHNKSEFMCAQCHDFKNVTPSPLLPLSFLSKSTEEKTVEASEKVPEEKPPAAPVVHASVPSATDCTSCHSDLKFGKRFGQTPHGKLNCTICHSGITDLTRHTNKEQKPKLTACYVCHSDVNETYAKSYHAVVAKITCLNCHVDIHPTRAVHAIKDEVTDIQICTGCHGDQDRYVKNGHPARILAGNKDAASCSDCHGVHNTPVFAMTDAGIAAKRSYYTNLCVSCHREGGVAGKYGVFPMAVKTYGETYHGKVRQLGHFEKVAGCPDCHTGHNILPPGNPASVLNPQALVKTCGKCHHRFTSRFVSYMPHPDPDNPKQFLPLYLTKKFMIALLAAVFGFFWIHVLLWWRKAYAEKRCLVRGGGPEPPAEESLQYVRRFSMHERVMHVVLILSFFGLVVSGFPLKYPDSFWARAFMAVFGGIQNAGITHRTSAAIMWLLFLYTCWLLLKFLFPGFRVKGWVGRLFGPDSFFPRVKDFQDCWGMFKWFFNRGERPRFDRWTYWEKFDFMAVFWGMLIIGLSGVIMSMPELSSHFMPGWIINIVYLAHSEEALLAAVFIFTIHFFNNHLVPDKFPLERNIFTGSYTLDALKRERPEEYERVLKENRLKEIKCKSPGTAVRLFAGIFGIASVLVGLTLTVLIFWAVFTR